MLLDASEQLGPSRLAEPRHPGGAAQFIDLCQSTLTRPRLFNAVPVPPDDEEIARVVGSAVTMFLAQYGVRQPGLARLSVPRSASA